MQRATAYTGKFFLLLAIIAIFAGCGSTSSESKAVPLPPTNEEKVTITQGVWGNVWFWEGDFMPTFGGDGSRSGKITPVIREIFVHRMTTLAEILPYSTGTFYSYVPSELVAVTSSDQAGFYQVALSPGIYSVFVKEGSVFYANKGDLQGRVNTVEVLPGAIAKLQLDITYQATF